MTQRFSLGIDLGTSNSAVARTGTDSADTEILGITQVLGPNQIGERPTLPSALYLPHPDEFPAGAFPLPWPETAPDRAIVGQFARDHGALVPDRLVSSAKSWLSNPHIDPRQPVLPWLSESVDAKLSPFECSRRYLDHLRRSLSQSVSEAALAEGLVVLTVPASFDEVARTLTAEAAEAAGLGRVTLLEEPLAAFYAWADQAGRDWRGQIGPGDIVLVCDVGGGTADFSLIAVSETESGELDLDRVSVGEHILLGGDNMDLALAYALRAGLEAEGKQIGDVQFLSLVHSAARAKVALLEDESLAEVPITVPSRGSSLFGGSISTRLDRATLQAIVLDGFFARTGIDDMPKAARRAGLQEFGLAYAADPVISKHLARFLVRSLENVRASEALSARIGSERLTGRFLAPTAVLFNGGVFKAQPIRARVLDLLREWSGGAAVRELAGAQPDLAVAKGAAVFGRIRLTGKGIRVKAGAARSYYIGLESSMPAVPGFTPPLKALCVVPQGMEEGSEIVIEGRDLALLTGQPAEFRFFASDIRSGDAPGTVLPDAERALQEVSLLEIVLPEVDGVPPGQPVPVQVNVVVTDVGTLEVWMKHTRSDRRWKVEFQVRTE
ncbi:Hsp70 family protein [Magnetospirillum fulvum]|uniref:Heat shock protein 70 family protein n=1 Tax=Magnetospirillum fulvum MGU-K5 TaxID=1316936 RepID=S9TL48_MAGFU|nr:Hsp70 family protein [Magnetospirillum fulvum]EPY02996.1 heat shock protein 70 family protein [Magnetospirillum fulvum MGU-K5]